MLRGVWKWKDSMITVLTEKDYCVTAWSGGTTKQLAIAPEGAVYADRDFAWRLSSATVELEESDFTALPDYMRIIAPLRGEMRLWHNGTGPIELQELELHRFDGGDDTHSAGKCTDYNLMLRKGQWDGAARAVKLAPGEETTVQAPAEVGSRAELLLYCVAGKCTVTLGTEKAELSQGETLRADAKTFTLSASAAAELMAAWAWRC